MTIEDYSLYGLSEADAATLISLACAAADEAELAGGDTGAYNEALASFSDPDVVHRLAVETWCKVEQG